MFARHNKSRFSYVLVFAAMLVSAAQAADAAKRVALLIGNQEYRSVPALKNPANDVDLIKVTLVAAGFDDVVVAKDLDLVGMRKALRAFEEKSQGSEVALLYYSGHGIEINGQNYLVPTDATLETDKDVEDEALPLDRAERALSGASRLKLVILDACRNNPFIDSMTRSVGVRGIQKGLAKVEPETSDTLVAYASRAGTVAQDGAGTNSPFAEALAKYIAQPGVDVRIALGQVRDDVLEVTERKQEPFVYGSLGGAQIYLSIKELNVTIEGKPGDKPSALSPAAEDWQNIKDLADKDLLNAFITKHGADPVYKMLAEKKLKQLDEAARKPDVTADQIAWDALKGSTDASALKRFVERYPESRFRPVAEEQLAMLAPQKTQDVTGNGDPSASRDCYLLAGEPQSVAGFKGTALARIDAKRSLTACKQAVNESPNDGALNNMLGRAYEADKNYKEAHRYYEIAAQNGDMFGLTNLGWLSVYGLDGPADVQKGKEAFEKAAKAGNHAGQAALGFLYRDGYGGVEKNDTEALRWYEKSASQGNAAALSNLGWFYREGKGVAQDYEKSVQYYRQGAEAGDLSAVAGMGYAAQNGLGMPQSYQEARRWYEQGANAGDAYSMASLGFLYDAGMGEKQDYIESRYWYEKAADGGSTYAMGNLARLYDQGLGTAVDPKEAVRWAIAAIQSGDKEKLQELKTTPTNFSAGFRLEMQKALKEKGLFNGIVNGDFGQETLDALDRIASRQAAIDTGETEQTQNAEGSDPSNLDNTTLADSVTFAPNHKSKTKQAAQCYRLAGEPGSEPNFPGVEFSRVDKDNVISICEAALETDTHDSMIYDMVGRGHDVARNYDKARLAYFKALEMGNIYAYTNLAWMAIYGNGEPQNIDKGMAMLHRAAEAGNSYAQASLGWVYGKGYGSVVRNYALSLKWYLKAADQDDANAQSSLGWLYGEGVGVERDYEKSFNYYMRAAKRGDLNAMGGLGFALQYGLGRDVDLDGARAWFEKAAADNHAYSIGALGWMYREGKGVKQDYAKALALYEKAASLGDVTSISSLGYMKQHGLGTPVDLTAALAHYRNAAAQNDAYANSSLGWMYREGVGVKKDLAKSLAYYEAAAVRGDLNSIGSLGFAYQNGLGTVVDFFKARQWFEKGVERNDGYSVASLGWMYDQGLGVPQDYRKARDLYQKAIKAGNSYAMGNLAYLLDKGLGGEADARAAAKLAISAIEKGETDFINAMKTGAGDYSPSFRKEMQLGLKERKVFDGRADGVFGASTSEAIERLSPSKG